MKNRIIIALAGNPNVGKTTLFNSITGARQHVGNWTGKTVEKKEGKITYKGYEMRFVDLPGTYSLTAYSEEELIAREYIISEKPDVIVNIVDAANLERNLFLTTQLMELQQNMILAVNFVSYAGKMGIQINEQKLSKLIGVPLVKLEANDKAEAESILIAIISAFRRKEANNPVRYNKELEDHISRIETKLIAADFPDSYSRRWVAIKLLEHDDEIIRLMKGRSRTEGAIKESVTARRHLESVFGEDIDTIFAKERYGFIDGLVKESVDRGKNASSSLTDRIDNIATNSFLGIPIFFILMWIMFQLTFTLSAPFVALIEDLFAYITVQTHTMLASIGSPAWLISLVNDAFLGGVGSVLVFAPNIFLLFLGIAILEDTGYMARVAFIMDRIMHRIGLHGKSSIPLILGFGCTVPAVMATRTLDSKKDKLLTMLITPFMSCSARLPVYVLFAASLFPRHQGIAILSIYILGMFISILSGFILNKILFKGLSSPLVMELPPYRLPTPAGLLIHMWERGKSFIAKAGTVIFSVVFVIWFLGNLPLGVEYASQESAVGRIGAFIAPALAPLGFGNWQSAVALIFGFVAKEVVIGTFGAIYGLEAEQLGSALGQAFTPLSAYSFMVFVLLYVPCISTIAAIRKETDSWRWPLFAVVYTTAVAWIVSFIVYQGGLLLLK